MIKKILLSIVIFGMFILTACRNNIPSCEYTSQLISEHSTTSVSNQTIEGEISKKVNSGLDITIEDLQPIISKACECEYLISHGGDYYFERVDDGL